MKLSANFSGNGTRQIQGSEKAHYLRKFLSQ
jgi:hypothetical protein